MVYLTHKLCGGSQDVYEMMQIGLINELIHLFALVHDDIADQGLTRRHRPTYHIQLRDVYEDTHMGDSQAILVGDLIYSWAVTQAFAIENINARLIIGEMIEKVIIGELLDVHYSYIESEVSADAIAIKDDLKSGQYTFTAPMLLGSTLAGANSETLDAVREIGTIVGVAFQMRDDLLDWLPDDDGKTKFSDIHEGNQTVVWSYLLAHVTQTEREKLLRLRRQELTDDDRTRLTELVRTYDLRKHIGERINHDLNQARSLISQHKRTSDYQPHMEELLSFLEIESKTS